MDLHPASKDIDSSEDARAIDLLEHGLVSGLQTGTLLLVAYNRDGWNPYQDSERSETSPNLALMLASGPLSMLISCIA